MPAGLRGPPALGCGSFFPWNPHEELALPQGETQDLDVLLYLTDLWGRRRVLTNMQHGRPSPASVCPGSLVVARWQHPLPRPGALLVLRSLFQAGSTLSRACFPLGLLHFLGKVPVSLF